VRLTFPISILEINQLTVDERSVNEQTVQTSSTSFYVLGNFDTKFIDIGTEQRDVIVESYYSILVLALDRTSFHWSCSVAQRHRFLAPHVG